MPRVTALLVAALVLPAALAAQPPASAPRPVRASGPVVQGAQDVGGYFGRLLLAALDSIPATRYGYRPTPAQQTVGYIAQHVADANYVLCAQLGGASRTPAPGDALPDTLKARLPKDTLVARLRASLVYCDAGVAGLGDAALGDSVTLGAPGAGRPVTRARALMLLVTDLAEHYSQLASYMRLLGMVPPSAQPRPAR